jgi:hypothetical protein
MGPSWPGHRAHAPGRYCYVVHYDAEQFAGLPLRTLEAALAAEGIPMSVSYPAVTDLALFRRQFDLRHPTQAARRLHEARAMPNQCHRLIQRERARNTGRSHLTKAMPHHSVRFNSPRTPQRGESTTQPPKYGLNHI